MMDEPNDLDARARRSADAVRALAARVSAGVDSLADLPSRVHVQQRRAPRRLRIVLAAAAILGACAVGVVALTRNTDTATLQSAGSGVDASSTSIADESTMESATTPPAEFATTTDPAALPAPPTTVGGSTTSGPSASVTTAVMTVAVLPTFDSVNIPLRGGEALAPAPLITIPFGSDPGHLVLQNGEFPAPIALLPDHIVVFEDEPFAGLTGRALLFDRDGGWLSDVSLPESAGSRVGWVGVAPTGTLFVAFSASDGSHLDAFSVIGTELVRTQTVPFVATQSGVPEFSVEAGGIEQADGDRIMEIETGIALDATTVTATKLAEDGVAVASVERLALQDSGSWTVTEEVDQSSTAAHHDGQAAPFGDGAWFADVASDDPAAAEPFIVLLSPRSDSRWYRLGTWAISASDAQRVLLSRVTSNGLELAALDASG